MKFYKKYPQLKDKAFLTKLLTDNVFATMALANRKVPKERVEEIVVSLLNEKELEGVQFFSTAS